MKKFLIIMMVSIFVISLVGSTLLSAKTVCPKDPPCLAEVLPDGSIYVCCYTYVLQHKECVLKLVECWSE